MIIFLYLILVLAWALLIIILKCKKARAKRLAEQDELAHASGGPVHVVQIGSNLYDIMSLHRDNYSGVYSCLEHGTIAQHRHQRSANTATVTHSNSAFVGDDGSIYPGNGMVAMEPPPSYDEVIRLPAYYPKVETFVPEMVVPPPVATVPSPRTGSLGVVSHPYHHHHPHYHHHHHHQQQQQQQYHQPSTPPAVEVPSGEPAILPDDDGPAQTDAPPLDTNGNRIKSVPVGVHHCTITTSTTAAPVAASAQTPAVSS